MEKLIAANKQAKRSKPEKWFWGSNLYILLAIALSVPVWIAVNSYANSIQVREDESVSLAVTVFFLLGIFSGRYITQVFVRGLLVYPVWLISGLGAAIIAIVAWLFFHADFPLNGRVFINLVLFWVPFQILGFLLGILLKMVHGITQNQLAAAQIEAAQSRSELGLLQSQMSPHFLFNTLNNLYGISITEHQKMPALLLKLSELLRYAVYDASATYVALKNEIGYLVNYIEFERIRIGERLVLETDIEEVTGKEIRIAPMLLIVFLENAFKHSRNTAAPEVFIEVSLRTWGTWVLFSVRNSYREVAEGREGKEDNGSPDNSGGLGLSNVRKRLDLLYPDEYELNTRKDAGFYTVELQLKIK